MVIEEAIRQARILRDTEIPDDVMVGWLSEHDGIVWDEVHSNYEGPEPRVRPSYGPDTDREATELLVKAPYDGMYPHYLAMKIDLDHQDIDRYNNEAAYYEAKRQAWANWYNRTHRWASSRQWREPRPRYYDTHLLF